MTLYDELQIFADEILAVGSDTFGQSTVTHPVSILRRSDVAGPTDLDAPVTTYAAEQVKAITRGVSDRRDGQTLTASSDKVAIVAALGVIAPSLDDRVLVGADEFAIVHVEPIANGEVVAIYRVYIKR